MAHRLAALKRRARAAGVPILYINDNFGQWRSDFRKTVAHCTSRRSPGRRVSQRLRPTSRDYFVRILAPADCIVSNTAADNDHALRQIATVLKGNVTISTRLRFRKAPRAVRAPRSPVVAR